MHIVGQVDKGTPGCALILKRERVVSGLEQSGGEAARTDGPFECAWIGLRLLRERSVHTIRWITFM